MAVHDRRVLDALLRQDFYSFLIKVFHTLNPGEPFLPNWHLKALCWYLEQVRLGHIRRLRIEVPPRSLKSVSASVAFPAFLLGHDPTRKIITASYSGDLAAKHSADCRTILQSAWYQRLYPATRLSVAKNQESNYETTARGYRYATSIGGTLTGRGGDLLIIDDPLKPEDAMSDARRDAANGWYSRTALSRLNNKSQNAIILVQQRLHMDDLAGHVDRLEEWTVLRLPAIGDEDVSIPIGPDQWYRRAAGEVLHSAREPLSVLEGLRRALGSVTFSAQYQQCPVPADGEVVRWGWFQRFAERPPLTQMVIHQSWDTASKADEHHDYSVCTTWGEAGDRLYLLDVDRERRDFPALKRRIVELAREWRTRTILIEDKGAGTSLIQQLRSEHHGTPYPVAFMPKDDKVTRLHAQSARIEAGHVWLPERAAWLEDLRVELAAFPQARHDDQVDSISQFLTWFFDRKRYALRMVPISGI
ncbi:MAG: phage terminase large subunit [Sphingomicrobium sp.]